MSVQNNYAREIIIFQQSFLVIKYDTETVLKILGISTAWSLPCLHQRLFESVPTQTNSHSAIGRYISQSDASIVRGLQVSWNE